MSEWLFTAEQLKSSPSVANGITPAEETELRIKGCKFLTDCALELGYPQNVISTALIFFHRFFIRQSFKHYDRYLVVSTVLFLAGKVEESPKYLSDVVSTYFRIRKNVKRMDTHAVEFTKTRAKIVGLERIVLHTMAFDLVVKHPHTLMSFWVDEMLLRVHWPGMEGSAKALKQNAWNFLNDASATTVCLQYSDKAIAFASVYLSFIYAGIPEEDEWPRDKLSRTSWWRQKLPVSKQEDFGMSEVELDAVCTRMLERYVKNTNLPVKIATLISTYLTSKRKRAAL